MPRQYSYGPRCDGNKDIGFNVFPQPESRREEIAIENLLREKDVVCVRSRYIKENRFNNNNYQRLTLRKANGRFFPVYSYTKYDSSENDGKVWSIIAQMEHVEYSRGGSEGIDLFLISRNEKSYCMDGPAAMTYMLPLTRHDAIRNGDVIDNSTISKNVALNKGYRHWINIFGNLEREAAVCLSYYALKLERGAYLEIVYPESKFIEIRDLIDELYNFIKPDQRWNITFNSCINTTFPFVANYNVLKGYAPHNITGFMIGNESPAVERSDREDEAIFYRYLSGKVKECIRIDLEEINHNPRKTVEGIVNEIEDDKDLISAVNNRYDRVVNTNWDLDKERAFPNEFYEFSLEKLKENVAEYQRLIQLFDGLDEDVKKSAEEFFSLDQKTRDQLPGLYNFNIQNDKEQKDHLQKLMDFDQQLKNDSSEKKHLEELFSLKNDSDGYLDSVLELGKKMNVQQINADKVKEWNNLFTENVQKKISEFEVLLNLTNTLPSVKDYTEFLTRLETTYKDLKTQESTFQQKAEGKLDEFDKKLTKAQETFSNEQQTRINNFNDALNNLLAAQTSLNLVNKEDLNSSLETVKTALSTSQGDLKTKQETALADLKEIKNSTSALDGIKQSILADLKVLKDNVDKINPVKKEELTAELSSIKGALSEEGLNAITEKVKSLLKDPSIHPIKKEEFNKVKQDVASVLADLTTIKDKIKNLTEYVPQAPTPTVSNSEPARESGTAGSVQEKKGDLIKSTTAVEAYKEALKPIEENVNNLKGSIDKLYLYVTHNTPAVGNDSDTNSGADSGAASGTDQYSMVSGVVQDLINKNQILTPDNLITVDSSKVPCANTISSGVEEIKENVAKIIRALGSSGFSGISTDTDNNDAGIEKEDNKTKGSVKSSATKGGATTKGGVATKGGATKGGTKGAAETAQSKKAGNPPKTRPASSAASIFTLVISIICFFGIVGSSIYFYNEIKDFQDVKKVKNDEIANAVSTKLDDVITTKYNEITTGVNEHLNKDSATISKIYSHLKIDERIRALQKKQDGFGEEVNRLKSTIEGYDKTPDPNTVKNDKKKVEELEQSHKDINSEINQVENVEEPVPDPNSN